MEKAACRRLERASRHSLDLISLLLSFLHVGLSRLNAHCNTWRGCVLVLSCGGVGVFRAQLLPSSECKSKEGFGGVYTRPRNGREEHPWNTSSGCKPHKHGLITHIWPFGAHMIGGA